MEILILLPIGILVLTGTFVFNYINKTLDQKLDIQEKELTNYFELKIKELNEKVENIVIDPSSVVVDLKPIEEKIDKNAESIVYLTDKKVNNELFNIKISEILEDLAETNTKLEVLKDLEETVMNVTEEANEELSNKLDDIILDINDFKDTTERNFQDTNNLIDSSATEVDMLSRQAEDFQQLHLDSQEVQAELENSIKEISETTERNDERLEGLGEDFDNVNNKLQDLIQNDIKTIAEVVGRNDERLEDLGDEVDNVNRKFNDLSSALGSISEEVLPSIEESIQNNSQLINTNIENIKIETEKIKGAIEEMQDLKLSSQDTFNNITALIDDIENQLETLGNELNKTDDKIATAIKTDNETRDASDNQKIIEEVSGIVTNLFQEAGIGGEGSDVGNTVDDVLNELNGE